jgi:hypothetical protein
MFRNIFALASIITVIGCGPRWPQAVVGPVNFCGAGKTYDSLVLASIPGSSEASELSLKFLPDKQWYSKLPIQVKRSHWGSPPDNLLVVTPADASKGEISGIPYTGRSAWMFLRGTEDISDQNGVVFFLGLGDFGAVADDGSIKFSGITFPSEAEFLRRADAARANPDCAFDPDLIVKSSGNR